MAEPTLSKLLTVNFIRGKPKTLPFQKPAMVLLKHYCNINRLIVHKTYGILLAVIIKKLWFGYNLPVVTTNT
jgi:hypothetical protein